MQQLRALLARRNGNLGGYYWDGSRYAAQLRGWSGASLQLENVRTWRWISGTFVDSVAVGDVEGDGQAEIVTGGRYFEASTRFAQLCVWA